jgi:hypothetical protein
VSFFRVYTKSDAFPKELMKTFLDLVTHCEENKMFIFFYKYHVLRKNKKEDKQEQKKLWQIMTKEIC